MEKTCRVGAPAAGVQRLLAHRVAPLHSQVPAMNLRQRLADNHPEPDEHPVRCILDDVRDAPLGVEIRLLQHVIGIDAAAQPRVDPEIDDPPQPVAMCGEHGGERIAVAVQHAVDQRFQRRLTADRPASASHFGPRGSRRRPAVWTPASRPPRKLRDSRYSNARLAGPLSDIRRESRLSMTNDS